MTDETNTEEKAAPKKAAPRKKTAPAKGAGETSKQPNGLTVRDY